MLAEALEANPPAALEFPRAALKKTMLAEALEANTTAIRLLISAPEGIRTPNQQNRNLLFYPIELRVQYLLIFF